MSQYTDDPAPEPAEDESGEDLPLIELETLLNRPPSPRKRLAQIVFVLVAIVMLAAFWGAIVPGTPTGPVVAPTPINGSTALLILSNVNFGTVTVNGKKQPGSLPMLVDAHSSIYTIRLDAPPFHSISCQIHLSDLQMSGFASSSRNCFASTTPSAEPMALNGAVGAPAFQMFISLTPNDLPPDRQSQVTAMLTQALTVQQDLTVPIGSYFATSFAGPTSITSQRASAPLRATATVAPIVPQGQGPDSPCVGFICPPAIPLDTAPTLTGHQWALAAVVALHWRFSAASGAPLSQVAFQGENEVSILETSIHLFLSLDSAGNWSISQNAPTPAIAPQLQGAFCSVGEGILNLATGLGATFDIMTIKDQEARGCAMELQANTTNQGVFLWRFGVLLAADKQAHINHPELPIAPPAEIAAVEQP